MDTLLLSILFNSTNVNWYKIINNKKQSYLLVNVQWCNYKWHYPMTKLSNHYLKLLMLYNLTCFVSWKCSYLKCCERLDNNQNFIHYTNCMDSSLAMYLWNNGMTVFVVWYWKIAMWICLAYVVSNTDAKFRCLLYGHLRKQQHYPYFYTDEYSYIFIPSKVYKKNRIIKRKG